MLPIGDNIPARNPPIATWTLILVNSFVFLIEVMLPPEEREAFLYVFAMVPGRGDSFQLVTNMFIHGGWLHIIANMWTLWIFGDNVEDRMGSVRFVIFYLLCGLAGNVLHLFMYPGSDIPTLGASGAIAGVLGAYFVMFPTARVIVLFPVLFIPFFFELPAVLYLGFWALSQVFSGTLSLALPEDIGGVGWWVHVGGFITGVVLHFFFVRRDRAGRDQYGIDAAWIPSNHWRKDR